MYYRVSHYMKNPKYYLLLSKDINFINNHYVENGEKN